MHYHKWSKWFNYIEVGTRVLHQTRVCKKCNLIEDRVPFNGGGNTTVLAEIYGKLKVVD